MENTIFLVVILGMTNYCNLNCDYCDWEKYPVIPLSEAEFCLVKEHLSASREFILAQYPYAQMIEYAGGEPYMYPEIVEEILRTFPEYWIRITTNGLLLTEYDIKVLKKHGRAYLGVSLDGETIRKNNNRFEEQNKLDLIVSNIDKALAYGVPVMMLCVLNYDNIEGFPEYLQWLSERWGFYIDSGMLILPAHLMTVYGHMHRQTTAEQMKQLQKRLDVLELPIYRRIREHYQAMFCPESICRIYRWNASIHFLARAIAQDGRFVSYQCGMRGIGRIGDFQIKDKHVNELFNKQSGLVQDKEFRAFRCNCFVDWRAFDLIFDGTISLERAKEWFVLFQDPRVAAWIQQYQCILQEDVRFRAGELIPNILQERRTQMAIDHKFFTENIDAVFFDLYGTLMEDCCDPEANNIWEIMAQFLGYHGAVYSADELVAVFGKLYYEVRDKAGQRCDPEAEHDEAEVFSGLYAGKGVEADQELIAVTAQVFRACNTKYCRLYQGAKKLICDLRKAGKKVCLLSNAQRIYTEPELRMNGLYEAFDAIRLSSDWGIKKPSKAFFKELINWVKTSPERILMVGNDSVSDILPARQLGMYTCYIHSNLSPKESPPPCNIYIEGADFEKLHQILLG